MIPVRTMPSCIPSCMIYMLDGDLYALRACETKKKRKYKKACEERRWHFTPFVCSVDGALGKEAVGFLKRLAQKLSGNQMAQQL